MVTRKKENVMCTFLKCSLKESFSSGLDGASAIFWEKMGDYQKLDFARNKLV